MAYTKNTWVDEVLSGAERYNIKTDAGSDLYTNVQILLAAAVLTSGTPVTADLMNNIEDWIDATDAYLFDAASELTIASDAITVSRFGHKVQPESGTSDNLATINGAGAGTFGVLYVSDFGTDTITFKHNTGNILCMGGADFALSHGCVFWYSNGTKVFIAGDNRFASKSVPSGALVGTTDTQTLTNKRVTPRAGSAASSATPTINTDNYDFYHLTAQAVDITSMTTNLSGTPTDGQKLWIAITGTAARAITWGTSFEAGAVPLPTTTVTTQRLDVAFVWNAVTSKWRCMASGSA